MGDFLHDEVNTMELTVLFLDSLISMSMTVGMAMGIWGMTHHSAYAYSMLNAAAVLLVLDLIIIISVKLMGIPVGY
jgi:hypothetical protein